MLTLKISSFSYKKGLPKSESPHGGGFVFDCRCITNPGREEQYKAKTGRDPDVKAFLEAITEAHDFFGHITTLVRNSVTAYQRRGFAELEVAFGCTGGQHRSVYFAEKLAQLFSSDTEVIAVLTHRDMPVSGQQANIPDVLTNDEIPAKEE